MLETVYFDQSPPDDMDPVSTYLIMLEVIVVALAAHRYTTRLAPRIQTPSELSYWPIDFLKWTSRELPIG